MDLFSPLYEVPHLTNGRDGLQIWRIVVNTLNKQVVGDGREGLILQLRGLAATKKFSLQKVVNCSVICSR
jgi:hypothetical protein